MPTKVCFGCKEEKSVDDFGIQRSTKDGRCSRCKPCRAKQKREARLNNLEVYKATNRRWSKNNPRKYAEVQYKTKHGITKEQMLEILAKQGGCCKICGTTETSSKGWVIDHDHSCCGKLKTCEKCRRGILCQSCNSMLGFAKDNTQLLQNGMDYLRDYERKKNAITFSDDIRGSD